MKKHPFFRPLFLFIFFLFFLTGCGSKKTSSDEPPVYVPLQVLVPSADGKEVLGNPPLTLDISNKEQGYMIAQANESASSINIQMTGPDGILYTYFVSEGTDAVIPFTGGEGSYQILCYQQVSGNKYAALCSHTLEVSLENPFLPYLYPNQYVDFTPESEACLLAQSMLPDDASDLDGLDAVYNYVISNITYDEEKAQNITWFSLYTKCTAGCSKQRQSSSLKGLRTSQRISSALPHLHIHSSSFFSVFPYFWPHL